MCNRNKHDVNAVRF